MADIKHKIGTPIIVSDVTDHTAPTALNNLGAHTDQIDLTGVATLEARESDKLDFGSLWEMMWSMQAAIEFQTAPVIGQTVDFYIGFSSNATAATGNPGYLVGADGDYIGGVAELAEGLKQITYIGPMVVSADFKTTVQVAQIGAFVPLERYGTLVVVNSTDDAFNTDAGGANEMSIRLAPIGTDIT